MRKFLPFSLLLSAVLVLAGIAGVWSFSNRVGCLFQSPYKSAISGWDNSHYFYWLRSPVIDGDFDFRNDIEECKTIIEEQKETALQSPLTKKGLIPNKYPVGWAVSNLPPYLLAHWGVKALNLLTASAIPPDGYGMPYQFAIHLTQFFYGILGLFFAWQVLRKWFDPETAALAVLFTWLGSFLFAYQTNYLSMPHGLIFTSLAGSFLCAHRLEKNPSAWFWWVGMGFWGGLMIITRFQTAVYLLYPAGLALAALARNRALVFHALASILAGTFFIALQLAAWKMLYGTWLTYAYTGEKFFWSEARFWDILFSPQHGLFYWHPLLLLGFVGWIAFLITTPGWQRVWALSIAAIYWINAAWHCWWFGASFGLRAFEGCVLFFMVGMAFCLQWTKTRPLFHRCLIIFSWAAAGFNLLLLMAVRKNLVSMDDPVSHRQMLEGIFQLFSL